MSVITLTPQARELLMTAIEGYLDHDLDYDLREADRAVATGGPGEWTQEDVNQMHTKAEHLKELHAALSHGEAQLSGENVALNGALGAPTQHDVDQDAAGPAEDSGQSYDTALGGDAEQALQSYDDGEVIEDELIAGDAKTDTALVIELIGDEYQVYSQEMIAQPGGGHISGRTGEVAQFATYAEASVHFAEMRHLLSGDPHRTSGSVSTEQTQVALAGLRQQATTPEPPGLQ